MSYIIKYRLLDVLENLQKPPKTANSANRVDKSEFLV